MLAVATATVSLLALWAVAISGAPEWLRVVLIVSVVSTATISLTRMLRPRIRSLLWRADGAVELVLAPRSHDQDKAVMGTFQSARVMGPLIVLVLRWPPHGHATLWVLPDNLDAYTRRRLRMRLGSGPAGAPLSGNADSG